MRLKQHCFDFKCYVEKDQPTELNFCHYLQQSFNIRIKNKEKRCESWTALIQIDDNEHRLNCLPISLTDTIFLKSWLMITLINHLTSRSSG